MKAASWFLVTALASAWAGAATASDPAAEPSPLPEPLTLGAALGALDDGHPNIARSQALQAESRARLDAAQGGYRPTLTLDARLRTLDAYEPGADPSNNDSQARLVLGQTLYDFGRTSATVDAGEARVESDAFQLQDRRNGQALAVMRRFFDVILADLANTVANEAMAITYISMDKATDRHEMGQISDIDLLDAERQFQASRSEFSLTQAEQRRTRMRLAHALNRPDQLSAALIRPNLPARERPALAPLLQEVLENSPRLHQQRALVRSAEARLEAARSDRWPTLRAEIEGAAHHREIGSRTGPFAASLILEMELFDGGRKEAEIAGQLSRIHQQRAQLRAAELEIREQATELWLQLETLGVRLEELESLADYRELYLDRSRALYELEVTTDLGDAMTRTSEVRLQQAEAEFDLAMTWARLDALRGKPITIPAAAE